MHAAHFVLVCELFRVWLGLGIIGIGGQAPVGEWAALSTICIGQACVCAHWRDERGCFISRRCFCHHPRQPRFVVHGLDYTKALIEACAVGVTYALWGVLIVIIVGMLLAGIVYVIRLRRKACRHLKRSVPSKAGTSNSGTASAWCLGLAIRYTAGCSDASR